MEIKGALVVEPFTVRLPTALHKAVREVAFFSERSMNRVITEILALELAGYAERLAQLEGSPLDQDHVDRVRAMLVQVRDAMGLDH